MFFIISEHLVLISFLTHNFPQIRFRFKGTVSPDLICLKMISMDIGRTGKIGKCCVFEIVKFILEFLLDLQSCSTKFTMIFFIDGG
jgi:hypothetical protein